MKKNAGSTIALIFGWLYFVSGLVNLNPGFVIGPVIILGALAYRSAKKRNLNIVKNSWYRKTMEIFAIVIAMAAVLLQNDYLHLMITDPAPNFVIPLWVLITYVYAVLKNSNSD